jgi:hypothetical protein
MKMPVSTAVAFLTKLLVQRSPHLGSANVELASATLSAKNPQLMTWNTLAKALEGNWLDINGANLETRHMHAEYLTVFWDALVNVRPELGPMYPTDRLRVRRALLVDAAAAIGAFIHVAARLYPRTDFSLLAHLRDSAPGTSLDFFSRENPIWIEVGLLEPEVTRSGQRVLHVRNTKGVHAAVRQLVSALLGLNPSQETAIA